MNSVNSALGKGCTSAARAPIQALRNSRSVDDSWAVSELVRDEVSALKNATPKKFDVDIRAQRCAKSTSLEHAILSE